METGISKMKLVVIESPFAGDVERNIAYARRCVADSLARGEAPIASHLLYTQKGVLDDDKPEECKRGIEAGWAWMKRADLVAVYHDFGMSRGMHGGLEWAVAHEIPYEYRWLDGPLSQAQGGILTGLPPV